MAKIGILGWALVGLLALRLALMATVPVFEPSEARYAAISANMARSGDFVVPRFTYDLEYQSFDGKPPLVFQAGGLFCLALGTESPYSLQFAVRLFPLVSALLMLAILFWTVKATSDGETASLAVVVCATCTAFYAAAGISMTDMTLTCCVAGALLAYDCFARRIGRWWLSASAVAVLLGAGMIVKGPVALALFGLPVLADAAVNRRWRAFLNWRWLAVAPIFLIVAVPWFVLIEERNPGSVLYFFYNENFLRFVSHDYGDRYGAGREAFRGVSVLWALVATLPWVLVPAWGCLKRPGWARVRSLLGQFEVLSLAAIVGFWCLTSRVLLYYLFPVIPLFAAALAKNCDRTLLRRLAPWCALVSAAVVAVALAGGALFSEKMRGARTPFEMLENHYANEFYHGTKSEEELSAYREKREAFFREHLRRKAERERAAKEGKK